MLASNVTVIGPIQQSPEWEEAQEEIKRIKQELARKQRKLETEKRKLEQEKYEFQRNLEMQEKMQAQEKRLFDMKWKVLEEELIKMAEERRQLDQKKDFYYQRLQEQEEHLTGEIRTVVRPGVFFKGVGNELALKKRYKDLLKIFHPDNLSGDTKTLQEINREYDQLKSAFGS